MPRNPLMVRRLVRPVLKAIGLTAILIWSLLPIAMIVLSSFKGDRDIFAIPPRFAFAPTLANYAAL